MLLITCCIKSVVQKSGYHCLLETKNIAGDKQLHTFNISQILSIDTYNLGQKLDEGSDGLYGHFYTYTPI